MEKNQTQRMLLWALGGMGLIIGYLLLRINGLEGAGNIAVHQATHAVNLWVVFVTGLTVGGLTCLAVQGGLLASTIAAREESDLETGSKRKHTIFATLAFLSTKLIAYTLLGFVLGAFGGALNISSNVQIIMQLVAGVYMIAIALNLLEVHPIFRYAVIQPPRFLTRMVRSQSKSKDLFAPAFLGAMTIFIPCGTTLAMETLAISSASAFLGALTMFFFILGTTPVFFGVGFLTSILGDNFQGKFLKLAAIAVLYLGVTSINGALVASGSPISFPSISIDLNRNNAAQTQTAQNDAQTTQNPEIDISAYGYSPTYIRVKKGEPVNITLKTKDAFSCASAFRIPSLNIAKNLQPNDTQLISFVPNQTGPIQFNCSMGMYKGIIDVL